MIWLWLACGVPDDSDVRVDTDPVVVDTDPIPDEDTDGDGSPDGSDCEKYDPTVYPGNTEVPWNSKDDDCDGRTDADGAYSGSVSVKANTVYDGKSYSWTLVCPTTLQRTGSTLSFDVFCTTDPEVPLQRQALGEELHVEQLDNIAAVDNFVGSARVWSSDGWDSTGSASASWSGDKVSMAVALDSVFLDFTGAGSVTWTGAGR